MYNKPKAVESDSSYALKLQSLKYNFAAQCNYATSALQLKIISPRIELPHPMPGNYCNLCIRFGFVSVVSVRGP